MTIVMPENVIDTEVYVKTSKEHIGLQMDPWMSCSWKRTWSSTHPPNTQTKEKIRKFRLQKAGRRISLFRTAGRPRQRWNSHWSPRPETRCHTYHPERRTPSPTKQAAQDPRPSPFAKAQMTKKRERGDWSDSTDSAPETAYHEISKVPGKIQSTILSPESPPEYEKGLSNLDYVPKSPVYYPAGYSDDDSDQDSLIDLNEENWDEDHSARGQKSPTQPEKETTLKGPSAEEKAEQSPSPQPETYQPGDRIGNVYLDSEEQLLKKLSKIADSVNPVADEDCWKKRRMFNSYKRLDMAAKLNQWQKTDDSTEDSQATGSDTMHNEDQATQFPTGDKDNSTQKHLDVPLTFPVEPMTCPPDIVHPIPSTPSQMSPDVPANFTTKLNKVAKMRTGPICYKAKLVNAMTTRPRVILQRLPVQDIKIHSATI